MFRMRRPQGLPRIIEMQPIREVAVPEVILPVEEQAMGKFEVCLSMPLGNTNDKIMLQAIRAIQIIHSRGNVVKLLKEISIWLASQPVTAALRADISTIADSVTPQLLRTENEIQGIKNIIMHIMMQVLNAENKFLSNEDLQFYLVYYKQLTYQKIIPANFAAREKDVLWQSLRERLEFELRYSSDKHRDYLSKIFFMLAQYVAAHSQPFYKRLFFGELPLRSNIEFMCGLFDDVVDALNAADQYAAKILLQAKITNKLETLNLMKRAGGKLRADFQQLNGIEQARDELLSNVSLVYIDYVHTLETALEKKQQEIKQQLKAENNAEAQLFFQRANVLSRCDDSIFDNDKSHGRTVPICNVNLTEAEKASLAFLKSFAGFMKNQQRDKLTTGNQIYDGAYGVVYNGVYNDRNHVAIKVVSHAFAYECKNEITHLVNLRSDHVIKLKDFIIKASGDSVIKPSYYIITEYVTNGALYDFMRTPQWNQLAYISRLELAMGILNGLIYLHEQNVIHADLKSPNILIDESNKPILADFGSAVTKGTTNYVRGTPCWMAIELLKIYTDSVAECIYTEAIDVYSFAIILYEILVGNHPYDRFMSNSREQIRVDILQNPTLIIPPRVDSRLNVLMMSCWNVRPDARPTAAKVKAGIELASQATDAAMFTPT